MAKPRRPIPDDFVSVAPTLCVIEAVDRWSVSPATLYSWEARTGVRCERRDNARGNARRIPADFAAVAGTMPDVVVAKLYGVAPQTVCRWRQASGITSFAPQSEARKAAVERRRKGGSDQPVTRFVARPARSSALQDAGITADLYRTAMQAFGRAA